MRTHKINHYFENIILYESYLVINRKVASKVEIIEPKFPGDDRERKIIEYKEEKFLIISIPEALKENIYLKKNKLDYSDIEIKYSIVNGENILDRIEIFDLDELNNCW